MQAFKIVPYNTETLDKLLTESLKKNIPASGLHLFGINQLEEEDVMTSRSTAISIVDGVACYTPGQCDVGRAVSLLPASTKVNKKIGDEV